ncbi:MAG: DoxX family protein [Pseudonocardia sp.]|nr:DoxX family protein [Pseudonocardia sp.]
MTTVTINEGSAGRRRQGRAANRALWVLQVLTSALFVFASVPKLTADPMAVAGFEMMGLGTTGMYIIGGLELLGAVALLVPVLCGLAALAQVALMIGAVLFTLIFMGVGSVLAMPVGTLVAVSVIAWARRRRTVELVALARRHVRG